MMRQFLAVRGRPEFQGHVILWQMGEFFEVFFHDAELVSSALGIALTKRGSYNGRPIPMAGFPIHAIANHLPRLLSAGLRAVVVEQQGSPSAPGSGAGVMKRRVTRVLTPGTLVGLDDEPETRQSEAMQGTHNGSLVALVPPSGEGAAFGVAWADIGTGHAACEAVAAADLPAALARFPMAELILPKASSGVKSDRPAAAPGEGKGEEPWLSWGAPALVSGAAAAADSCRNHPAVRALTESGEAAITACAPTSYDVTLATPRVRACLLEAAAASSRQEARPEGLDLGASDLMAPIGGADSLLALSQDPAARALCGLLSYLEWTQRGSIPPLQVPELLSAGSDDQQGPTQGDGGAAADASPSDDTPTTSPLSLGRSAVLLVDGGTAKALELHRNAQGRRRGRGSLLNAIDLCKTAAGSRLLDNRLAAPLTDPDVIDARLDAVARLVYDQDLRHAVRSALSLSADVERALQRVAMSGRRASPRDLAAIRDGLLGMRRVGLVLASGRGDLLEPGRGELGKVDEQKWAVLAFGQEDGCAGGTAAGHWSLSTGAGLQWVTPQHLAGDCVEQASTTFATAPAASEAGCLSEADQASWPGVVRSVAVAHRAGFDKRQHGSQGSAVLEACTQALLLPLATKEGLPASRPALHPGFEAATAAAAEAAEEATADPNHPLSSVIPDTSGQLTSASAQALASLMDHLMAALVAHPPASSPGTGVGPWASGAKTRVAQGRAAAATSTPNGSEAPTGSFIRAGYSKQLDRARNMRDSSAGALRELEVEMRAASGISGLKLRRTAEQGFTVEVPAKAADDIQQWATSESMPLTWVRTLKSSVRYKTPQLATLDKELADSAARAAELEAAVFDELRARCCGAAAAIRAMAQACAVVDVAASAAEGAERHSLVRPAFLSSSSGSNSEDLSRTFDARGLRHLVVERAMLEGWAGGVSTADKEANAARQKQEQHAAWWDGELPAAAATDDTAEPENAPPPRAFVPNDAVLSPASSGAARAVSNVNAPVRDVVQHGRWSLSDASSRAKAVWENPAPPADGGDRFAPPGLVWLLTGPNMGGKSTFLRSVAQSVVLAQAGLFVPARSMALAPVDRLFARVGASDDVVGSRSTFLVEMEEVSSILQAATPSSLVVVDEVGRGTSARDGLAIAGAVLADLAQGIGCRTLFATHFHELAAMEDDEPRQPGADIGVGGSSAPLLVDDLRAALRHELGSQEDIKCYCMAVDEGQGACDGSLTPLSGLRFSYKVQRGVTPGSYALHVAQEAGVPSSVLDRAAALMAAMGWNR